MGNIRVWKEVAESAQELRKFFYPLRGCGDKQHMQPRGRVAGTVEGSTEARIEMWADDTGKEKKKPSYGHE